MSVTWKDDQGFEWDYSTFLGKLESEGGAAALLDYGGPKMFPPELQKEATEAHRCLQIIEERIMEIEDIVEAEDTGEDDSSEE